METGGNRSQHHFCSSMTTSSSCHQWPVWARLSARRRLQSCDSRCHAPIFDGPIAPQQLRRFRGLPMIVLPGADPAASPGRYRRLEGQCGSSHLPPGELDNLRRFVDQISFYFCFGQGEFSSPSPENQEDRQLSAPRGLVLGVR